MAADNNATHNRPGNNYSEQEKVQAFIRELALAFRRITGREVADVLTDLPVDLGKSDGQPCDKTDHQPFEEK
jgi:hypothetical protein